MFASVFLFQYYLMQNGSLIMFSLLHACKVMMLVSKKEGILSTPFQSGQKSASRFCLFSKVQSASPPPGNTPVYLNVYDLTPVNGYVFWVGLGIFHSGIEGIISSTCFTNNSVELTSQLKLCFLEYLNGSFKFLFI
jgi:hypothetical protein